MAGGKSGRGDLDVWARKLGVGVGALAGAAVVAVLVALCCFSGAWAQTASERAVQLRGAFQRIADRAAAGQWQLSDDAFNDALDELDRQRPAVEAEAGDVAREVFDRVAALLEDLDAALSAEDAVAAAAVVGYIQAELAQLAPDAGFGGPARAPTDSVLAWRAAAEGMAGLLAAGQFRDMRNAAMDLVADIERRGPAVARAAGPAGPRWVDQARIFAMRLRGAALDGVADDGAVAARYFDLATAELLVGLGVLAAPSPTSAAKVQLRLRSMDVDGQSGATVSLPVVAEDIPQVGLGAYHLRARWSPESLRLVDVTWDVGEGNLVRDDALGMADLLLPAAPTGPSGTAVLAQLQYEVAPVAVDARAYLPRADWALLEQAVAEAGDAVRLGDVPRAARALARAYFGYVDGRGQPGSLFAVLDGAGLGQPLADKMLAAVDVSSQPAAADVLAATLADLDRVLAATPDAYLASLAPQDAVPVTFEVLAMTDTAGQPLAVQGAERGLVRVKAVRPEATAFVAEAPSVATAPPTAAEPAGATTGSGAGGTGGTGGAGGGGSALAMLVVLGLAALAGLGVVLWTQRSPGSEPGAADVGAGRGPGGEAGGDGYG